ncbi:MAG: cysteine--tRNA ligase [Smithellaceae bacterium]|nr:cysteine--tRNA ligase [Smithellaceae bacterium]
MSLRIYNTLTRQKDEFKPLISGKVGIYVCGITAYDLCHIGHARSAIVFDVIARYFRYRGSDVLYVKNFTDVDDKIIMRANREGTDIGTIADQFIAAHNEDMDSLGVVRPDVTPRATDNIGGMIKLIETLIDKGLAYERDGDVYYAVEKFAAYGKLSRRSLEEMEAGARIDVNENKRNPLDFALWKKSKENEPWWESPWGRGRPGWHIECSVMSQRYLGATFDIHGGGEDLIFPHHENEIAQSEGASGLPLANYWIHNGFVKVNAEKMSKSLGNFSTIRDMLKDYHPEVLRLFVLQSHYRSPVDFSAETLHEARLALERLYGTLKALKDRLAVEDGPESAPAEKTKELSERMADLRRRFCEAMDDDFNTARALGHIFEAARQVNGYLAENKSVVPGQWRVLKDADSLIRELGAVLGFLREDPDEYFRKDRDREANKRGVSGEKIEALIAERRKAREALEWKRADEIRDELAGMGVILKDTPSGTTWKIQ